MIIINIESYDSWTPKHTIVVFIKTWLLYISTYDYWTYYRWLLYIQTHDCCTHKHMIVVHIDIWLLYILTYGYYKHIII